mgnify:CR=1 FL=1
MAENNKTVKLYTGDVVAATSSKGNQEKWYDAATDCWYKLDRTGFCRDTAILKQNWDIEL